MINATTLKRFFKKHYDIAVRVSTGRSQTPYIEVRIPPKSTASYRDPLQYDKLFPPELGYACLQIIYGKHWERPWAGNVAVHMIAMHAEQWQRLIDQIETAPAVTTESPEFTALCNH